MARLKRPAATDRRWRRKVKGWRDLAEEDWDDLRFILAVAEEGTVSAAARRLSVNHATVLRRIARFESRNGRVFDKTPRGYSLAPGRQDLVAAGRDVERAVMGVSRLLAGGHATLSGEVRVTSTDSFCLHLLPQMVARIMAGAPALSLTLLSSNAHLDLARVEADVTVRPTGQLPGGLTGERVATLGFAAFESASGGQAVWLALSGRLKETVPGRWLAGQAGDGMSPAGAGADSFLTLRELAATGSGRALLPAFMGDADPRLRRADVPVPPLSVGVWVASHADLAAVPRIAHTRRCLAEALRAKAVQLAG